MGDGHDFAVIGPGQDAKSIGKGIGIEGQRMIPADVDRFGKSLKERVFPVEGGDGLFAVHQFPGVGNGAAVDFTNGLMAQADAEDRNLSLKIADGLFTNPGIRRRPGPGEMIR